MDKGRRVELRQLRFVRRLRNLGLKQRTPKDYVCYKDSGKPCSCSMCRGQKYNRAKKKREVING